jgi:hypothetical protein
MKFSNLTFLLTFFLLIKKSKLQSSIDLLGINVELSKLSDTQQIEIKLNGSLGNLLNIKNSYFI